ncbi:hypothetical protein AB0I28_21825 [Phytomonospora sp. NPDC050363]|uniref:hypothetical protein n=1 Tax=Phytomonospora sp. NPDC050363 TaxID=3155642 RepID=UPI0033D79035
MSRQPDLVDERLAALLTAAAAPARPGETAGEEEAVRAYRTLLSPVQPTRARRLLVRFAVVKAVIAITLLGGVALAASSSEPPEHPAVPGNTADTAAGERETTDGTPATLAGEEPPPPSAKEPSAPTPGAEESAPAADFPSLCRLYLDDEWTARRDPGFPALRAEAGGHGKVGDHCRELLGVDEENDDGEDHDPGGDDENGEPSGRPDSVPGPPSVHKGRPTSPEQAKGPKARPLRAVRMQHD